MYIEICLQKKIKHILISFSYNFLHMFYESAIQGIEFFILNFKFDQISSESTIFDWWN